jgi:hypothetical protein
VDVEINGRGGGGSANDELGGGERDRGPFDRSPVLLTIETEVRWEGSKGGVSESHHCNQRETAMPLAGRRVFNGSAVPCLPTLSMKQ